MISAPLPENETERLKALIRYEILDSEDEIAFDELTQLASNIVGCPISLVSLIDADRQWFKSRVGLDAQQTDRDVAFCSHAILQDEIFEVKDATQDERFKDNPLVTGNPDIRFYAGAPLIESNGYPLGTLCVIDTKPRELTDDQRNALKILAKQVIGQLELRLKNKSMARLIEEKERMYGVLAHDLRSPFTGILGLARLIIGNDDATDKIKDHGKKILESAVNAYTLLDEILQWTEKAVGDIRPKKVNTNLLRIIHDSSTIVMDAFDMNDIEFQIHVKKDINCKCDPTLTKAILRNLLSNAIKFTPKGGRIEVSAELDGDYIRVTVFNTGNPIPKATIDRLFTESVDSATDKSGNKGSGIGLRLSGYFIEKQDGNIWVDKGEKNGARFTFELPDQAST